MKNIVKLPYILSNERTPLVNQLLDIVKNRDDYIEELEREIRRLKKPSIDWYTESKTILGKN